MNEPLRWHFDEMQHTGADFADPQVVQVYDDRMQRFRNIPKEVETARQALQLASDHTLIEIGVGTGEFAIALSAFCREVIATDISPTMLEFAQKKATARNRSNIRFVQAGFLTYHHVGESADAVLSQLALHHLPDFWKMIAMKRIYALLKKGGRFFLRDIVYSSHLENYDAHFDHVTASIRETAGDEMAEGTTHHILKEYSTLDWVMEGMLRQAGFAIHQVTHIDGFVAQYLCVK